MSSAVRPWMALATSPWHVLLVRLADREGKGVRSAPRDALLTEVTSRARARGALDENLFLEAVRASDHLLAHLLSPEVLAHSLGRVEKKADPSSSWTDETS